MKKLFSVIAVLLMLGTSVSFSQSIPWHNSLIVAGTSELKGAVTCSTTVNILGAIVGSAAISGTTGTFTGAVGISNTATIKNLTVGYGITAGRPLLITGKLGTTVAYIDSVGLAAVVGLTTTGAITATSQTVACGAITSSGTSLFAKLKVGVVASGSNIVTIDSVVATDSIRFYLTGGKVGTASMW
jgi:hypothetical protein